MKRFLLSGILFLLCHFANAQNNSSVAYTTLADSLYRHHSYHSAALYYEKALKKSSESGRIMLQIAKCYSTMNKVKEAELWFKKAKTANAQFSDADAYQYAHVLMMEKKRDEAIAELKDLLQADPKAAFARQMLDDVLQYKKYYQDSAKYILKTLNINTAMAEFSPQFYKEGIVFSSAQPQDFTKKKYHWDNTHFLSLYYSAKVDESNFKPPVEFDKKLDSRFHDGPAAFYLHDERMIINRNEQHVLGSKKTESSIWHLSLYDAIREGDKKEWKFTLMPFNEAPYSFAHPSISEDGNILYFVSNRPGGYGGNDIYRALRKFGVWSAPFNIGPAINTSGDEEFPFFINNTLYFSSTGHGGMGGLDIFKSTQEINGFSEPVNVGYPINSNYDDLSIILTNTETSGYFSSARNGNDDLFYFKKQPVKIEMLAQIIDHETREPLNDANLQLITDKGETINLKSDSAGIVHFGLPEGTAYTLVGTKENKSGKISGLVNSSQDKEHVTHAIEAYTETEPLKVACIGTLKTEKGFLSDPVAITITDATTGKVIVAVQQQSEFINFDGEKGHTYTIEIKSQGGKSTTHELVIAADEQGNKTWTMIVPEDAKTLSMAARVFKADDNTALAGAAVKIMTFSDSDQEITANENGVVDFILPVGTAYVIVATKGDLTGMHSGIAEQGTDKASITHPVPAQGDPLNPLYAFALVTNKKGELLDNVQVVVIDKASGEKIAAEIKDGVLTFLARQGREYTIQADRSGYETFTDEIKIPQNATSIEKMSILLQAKRPAILSMAAHVFKAENNQSIAGASVKIMSFTEADKDTLADENGRVDFKLADGTAYVVVASKDGYTGMHSGIAEAGTDSASIVHPVPTHGDQQVSVIGQIVDRQGDVMPDARVIVTENSTGKEITTQLQKGILAFVGDKGKAYTVTVTNLNYKTTAEQITLPNTGDPIDKVAIVLDKEFKPLTQTNRNEDLQSLPLTASIKNKKGMPLDNATVTIVDDSTGQQVAHQFREGNVDFTGKKGKTYTITVTHSGYTSASEKIAVPADAGVADKKNIILNSVPPVTYIMAARIFKAANNESLPNALVRIISFSEEDIERVADSSGVVEFSLPEGTAYVIMGSKDLYSGMTSGVAEKGMDKALVVQPVAAHSDPENSVPVMRFIVNKQGETLRNAMVTVTNKATGKTIDATLKDGILIFSGLENETYTITAQDADYQSASQEIIVQSKTTNLDKGSIILQRKNTQGVPVVDKNSSGSTTLVMFGNDGNTTGLYLVSLGTSEEIIEKDGKLYLQNDKESKLLGEGTLNNMKRDPQAFMAAHGLSPDQITTIQNIYFDYNTAELDDNDKKELDKVTALLHRYPALQVNVNAHADDRGGEGYNLDLSKKRAKVISSYLGRDVRNRVVTNAYGESIPAIPCSTPGCSEEDHQKNRRAEFALHDTKATQQKTVHSKDEQKESASNGNIDAAYDDVTKEGLFFKVSIGAYRHNHSLTFSNLNDLGKVETDLQDGIMYYYLSGAPKLKQIKKLRQQVIKKGITDAAIVIFYHDKKISVEEFKLLIAK